jgi:sugar-specific transcriptional regulator TrmB
MTRFEDVLRKLGLDPLETKGYAELHRRGAMSAGTLAKRLGVPRTTVYTMLERLSGKGLIKGSTKGGVKCYVAESPDTIGHIISQRLASLDTAHKEFLELLPELRQKSARTTGSPLLTVMEGQDGLQSLLRDMLHYGNIQTCAVWPIKKMMEVLSPEFFRFHNIERIKRDIYTRAVWPSTEVVSIEKFPFMGWGKKFKREVRIAPESTTYELGYWIYANKVAFISSARESYGFLIQSEELAQTLTAQFELLWRESAPLKFNGSAVVDFLKSV